MNAFLDCPTSFSALGALHFRRGSLPLSSIPSMSWKNDGSSPFFDLQFRPSKTKARKSLFSGPCFDTRP